MLIVPITVDLLDQGHPQRKINSHTQNYKAI